MKTLHPSLDLVGHTLHLSTEKHDQEKPFKESSLWSKLRKINSQRGIITSWKLVSFYMETDVLLTTVIAQIFCKIIVSLGLMHRASGFAPAESKMSSLALDVHEAATPRSCCVCANNHSCMVLCLKQLPNEHACVRPAKGLLWTETNLYFTLPDKRFQQYDFERSLFCSLRLHLFDPKYRKTILYYLI